MKSCKKQIQFPRLYYSSLPIYLTRNYTPKGFQCLYYCHKVCWLHQIFPTHPPNKEFIPTDILVIFFICGKTSTRLFQKLFSFLLLGSLLESSSKKSLKRPTASSLLDASTTFFNSIRAPFNSSLFSFSMTSKRTLLFIIVELDMFSKLSPIITFVPFRGYFNSRSSSRTLSNSDETSLLFTQRHSISIDIVCHNSIHTIILTVASNPFEKSKRIQLV